MSPNSQIHATATLRYRFEVLSAGRVIKSLPFRDYMITDAGLDKVGASGWLGSITTPIVGESVSPTPVRRDSGAVTFTQSGNTLTASAGFFVAGDTGRLFKWGTGSAGVELYLTYVSATQCTTSNSETVSTPSVGTIWYVNTASLLTPVTGLTWSSMNDVAENFSTAAVVGDTVTVTHQRIVYSSAFSVAKTISEVAFSDSSTNSNLTDRDIISPTVALLIGDQAKITIQLLVKYSPVTPVAVGNIASGYDSSGTFQIEALGRDNTMGIDSFNAGGGNSWGGGGRVLEPNTEAKVGMLQSAITLQSFSFAGTVSRVNILGSAALQSYGTGTHFRDTITSFSISQANGTNYGVSLQGMVTLKFTAPLTKLATQTLNYTFRKSWSRMLTN